MGKKIMGHETEKDIKELEQLKKELAKDPDNVELLFKIGMLLCGTFHDIDIAIQYFEKAMLFDSTNPDLPFWAGYFLCMEMFEYEKAKKLFELALSLDPDRAVFNNMMFYVLWQMTGDEKVGLKYLLRAIGLQPEWPTPREQHITNLINKNEFDKAEQEIAALESAIKNRCKNKRTGAINILEKFYWGETGSFDCEVEIINIDYKRKKLKKKKEEFLSES